jgi:hypothetical protein
MRKFLILSVFFLVVVAPAVAKSADAYPVSCNDLWAAVTDTLSNPHNYGILSKNDLDLKASFTVIGNLNPYTDRVALTAKDGGCTIKTTILEVGSDNTDWLQFHRRIAQSLAKLQAAKSKPESTAKGQL